MDRVPFKSGKQRRDADRSTMPVEPTTSKVEAALTSRDEAAKLRRRLLEMIVENERKRQQSSDGLASTTSNV